VTVVPLRGIVGPCTLEPARDRMAAYAGAEFVLPTQALLVDRATLRLRTKVSDRRSRTVGLAHGMTADDKRDRLLVVHRHAGEGLADVPRSRERARLASRPFRIHVDQSHLHIAERIGELP